MKSFRYLGSCFAAIVASLVVLAAPAGDQKFKVEARTLIGDGWYPWYELKSDPENPQNLIVCGTKYEAGLNSFAGFVFASNNGAATWREVLSDRSTPWVTEHSCAFGPHHLAYFISEASKVVDGETYHELGTTRLYVSKDGGQNWLETSKTAWADHSTSAVSEVSGSLYTFFNSGSAKVRSSEPGGTTIGLLIFSPDGKVVNGPFFDPLMIDRGHYGTYPSQALALKSGAVVALYQGLPRPPATESEFGIVRAIPSPNLVLESTIISHTSISRDCPLLDRGSLAYDPVRDRLFVLFGDGCKSRQMMLTVSEDEGKTWSKAVPVGDSGNQHRTFYYPSLLVDSRGSLTLLWRDRPIQGNWCISQIQNQQLVEPVASLSSSKRRRVVKNDSLWTTIFQPNSRVANEAGGNSQPSVMFRVLNMEDRVWRSEGLVSAGDHFVAVWPLEEDAGTRLYSGIIVNGGSASRPVASVEHDDIKVSDVTGQSRLLYGGNQQFDQTTATLKVCALLANRGDAALKVPIKLEATSISSPIGAVSILNASNGLTGAGAVWDISDAVAGGEILPQTTSEPFCLSFHVQTQVDGTVESDDANLLIMSVRVLSGP